MALMLNHLGSYTTIEAVWADHPEGGREGDYVTVGGSVYYWDKYSRCWVQTSAVPSGGGGEVVNGDLSVSGNLGVGGNAVINGTLTVNGVVFPGNSQGGGGGTGQSSFKSIVFRRSASRPSTPGSSQGSWGNPVPSGWYDGVPSGSDPIWMSGRVFTSDGGSPQQDAWSVPALMSDAEDFDVEFSPWGTDSVPAAPEEGNLGTVWFDPVRNPDASWNEMKWMATRTRYLDASGNPAWTAWKIMLIKGEQGEAGRDGSSGDGVQSVYAVSSSVPTITSQGYPPRGSVTWHTGVDGLEVTEGAALWMSERRCTGGVWGAWSSPVRISGFNGADGSDGLPGEAGADGADIEFIYKQSNTLPTAEDRPADPSDMTADDEVPDGWSDHPSGVDSGHKYEWMCQRVKRSGSAEWGSWVGPLVWCAWGDKGMDGDGLEYIFRRGVNAPASATLCNPSYRYSTAVGDKVRVSTVTDYRGDVYSKGGVWYPEDWEDSNGEFLGWSGGSYVNGEWIPTGWSDNPVGVDATNPKEWVSIRKRHDGVWGNWSSPALWSVYSEEHTVEIIDGEWWIDGSSTGVRAEGKDGTGVSVKGTAHYLTAAQAKANAAGLSGTLSSLEGITADSAIVKSVGDCYVVDYVDVSSGSSSNWVRGHIYVYNGSTGSSWLDKWTDLGQFRGEAGTSKYIHIAWATTVVKDDSGTVKRVADFVTDYESLADGKSYDWMGICVDNNVGDDSNPLHYDWNYVKGVDGASVEFVYIRTDSDTSPGLTTGYTDSNGRSNADAEYMPCATSANAETKSAASGRREYNDDPLGVDGDWPFEWMSKRVKSGGVWGAWSAPALWAMYSEDGNGIESVRTYYCLSMLSEGMTVAKGSWSTRYQEPTEELPFLWRFTQVNYTNGNNYTGQCELVATYSTRANPNLLRDTDFVEGRMSAWSKAGVVQNDAAADPGSSSYDGETFDNYFGIVEGTDSHNAYYGRFTGSNPTPSSALVYLLTQRVHKAGVLDKLEAGKWYTLSFWVKGGTSGTSAVHTSLNFVDEGSGVKMWVDGVEATANHYYQWKNLASSWKKRTLTFKTPDSLSQTTDYVAQWLMLDSTSRHEVYICMPKLEAGRMATAYTDVDGDDSPMMRTSSWAAGKSYMQGALGEAFIDVVSYGGSWYRCVRSHTSSSSLTPLDTAYWEVASGFRFVATDVLLAEQGTIRNLVADNIRTDITGKPRVEMCGAVARFFGTLSTPSIEMMVDADGVAYLRFYDKDGNVLYDLGPRGMSWLKTTVVNARFAASEYYVKMSGNTADHSESVSGQTRLYQFNAKRENGVIQGDSTYTANNAEIAAAADGKYFTGQSIVSGGSLDSGKLANGLYRASSSKIVVFSSDERAGDVAGMQSELINSYGLTQDDVDTLDWSVDAQAAFPSLVYPIYVQEYTRFTGGIMSIEYIFWQDK